MDERRKERVQEARGCQSNPNGIDDYGALEVLKDYSSTVARDAHGLDELVQVVSDQHNIGALTGHIRSSAQSNPDPRLTQRWSIIDTIAHHRYRSICLYLPGNQGTLVFREDVGIARNV